MLLYVFIFVIGAIAGVIVAVAMIGNRGPAVTGTMVAETKTEAVKVEPVYVQQPTHWYNPVSRKPERRG